MKRKTIKQGQNAVTITLPSDWIKRNNISPGNELDVKEEGNILQVFPNTQREYTSRSIDLTGLSNILIWREISSAYRAGYDEIRVNFENTKNKAVYSAFTYDTMFEQGRKGKLNAIETIQALVNRSIGVEIIEQGINYCIIKEMSEISHKEFDNIMRRIFLLLLNMIETIENSVKTRSTDELKNIHMIDTNLDRFEDFCIRVLNKIGYREMEKTTLIHNTVFFLEMIGDEYKQLALDLMDSINLTKELKNKLFETDKMFESYYSLFYKFDDKNADRLIAKNENLKAMELKIPPRVSGREANVMAHCKAIRKYVASLMEIRIDMHYI